MVFHSALPILITASFPCALAQVFATVSGVTIDVTTGTPLAHMHVRLTAGADRGYIAVYGTFSDEKGRFTFSRIAPGLHRAWPFETREYTLLNEVKNDKRVTDLSLKVGDHVAGFRLYYARIATISGRVIGEDDVPVENASVSAVELEYRRTGFARSACDGWTDERGRYRLRCPPGKYRVFARLYPNEGPYPREVRADGGEDLFDVSTSYPHEAEEASAAVVEVGAGAETRGIDVRLIRSSRVTPDFDLAHNAVVEGVVLNSVTHQPVSHAHVSLRGASVSVTGREINRAYYAMTGQDGRFALRRLAAGNYRLWATHVGFVGDALGEESAACVLHGRETRTVASEITPGAVISGRVVDGNGNPAPRVEVEAEDDSLPLDRFLHHRFATTDENGLYRIHGLRPGHYRIRAAIHYGGVPPEIREDGAPDDNYGATYYPGTLVESAAQRVQANGGRETEGVDIRLNRAPILRITGRVASDPAGTLPTRVQLLYRDNGFAGETRVASDGTFVLWRVQPGKYQITAYGGEPGREFAGKPVEIDVGGNSLEGVALSLLPRKETASRTVQINAFVSQMRFRADSSRSNAGPQSVPFRLSRVAVMGCVGASESPRKNGFAERGAVCSSLVAYPSRCGNSCVPLSTTPGRRLRS